MTTLDERMGLLGRQYVDPHDSGDLLMKVVAIGNGEHTVWVQPVDSAKSKRVWFRDARELRPIIEAYEQHRPDEMLEAGEDMPLWSGTPVAVTGSAFVPKPVEPRVEQADLFGEE